MSIKNQQNITIFT